MPNVEQLLDKVARLTAEEAALRAKVVAQRKRNAAMGERIAAKRAEIARLRQFCQDLDPGNPGGLLGPPPVPLLPGPQASAPTRPMASSGLGPIRWSVGTFAPEVGCGMARRRSS